MSNPVPVTESAPDVPPGYKRTEVGVIPEDWEVKRLGEVAEIKNGATPNTHIAGYWSGTIPWCTPSDITGTPGKYLSITNRNITAEGLASCGANLLPVGSLLLCSRATIGEVQIATMQVCTNQGFKSLVCKPGVSNEFLYYVLLTLKPQMVERATGSTFLEIGKRDIASIRLIIPDEAEQRAIAEALSDVDELVSALGKLVAKKRAIKQAAMQQLLTGKTRLPGFSRKWETKQLGEIIEEIGDGATPSTANPLNFGGAIHWVVIDDIKDEIFSTKQTLTESGLRTCAAKLWQPGTLILSTGATIGEVGIARVPVATKQGICGLVIDKNKANTEFLKYWLVQNKTLLLSKAQGSSIKEVRAPTLVKFEIQLPPLPEQRAIAAVLSDMDAEIAALERRLDKTKLIKQGMMQQLLTGRIRLIKEGS